MFILLKTDTGSLRTINTDDISYLDGSEGSATKLYLKTFPEFPIRVGMVIRDLHKVVAGEAEFFDLYKMEGVYEEDPNACGTNPDLKEASKEDIAQVKKEFLAGKKLVSGDMGEGKLDSKVVAEVAAEKVEEKIAKEIPTFSKKKKKVVVKEESAGGAW